MQAADAYADEVGALQESTYRSKLAGAAFEANRGGGVPWCHDAHLPRRMLQRIQGPVRSRPVRSRMRRLLRRLRGGGDHSEERLTAHTLLFESRERPAGRAGGLPGS
jgi:hypothetical protein